MTKCSSSSEINDDMGMICLTQLSQDAPGIITQESLQSILSPELTLKPYQLVGINWLYLMHEQRLNGVLADEMGLGKTVQAITLLGYLHTKEINPSHHLVVVPGSTLPNWVREFNRWCPLLRVEAYHCSQSERFDMRMRLQVHPPPFDVIVTTYTYFERESCSDDRKFFRSFKFGYVILDEAHSIKNSNSSRFQRLQKISAKHRLLLTGTPIQNDLKVFYGKVLLFFFH